MTTGFTRHLRSVRARITIVATVVFAVAFVAAAWGLVRTVDRRVHSSARSAAEAEVRDLEDQILANRVNELTPQSHAVYFQLIDATDHSVLRGNAPPGAMLLSFN